MCSHTDGRMAERGIAFRPLAPANRQKTLACVVALLVVAAANLWAVWYVSAEHYIYYWDWAAYWSGYQQLGELAGQHPFAALKAVSASVRLDDYNLLQVAPLVPFELLGGPGRTSFIIAIANVGIIPSAALMTWLVARIDERRSMGLFIMGTATLLTLHPLWAAALRGFPDVVGVVVACTILLTFCAEPLEKLSVLKLVRLGALLCLIVLVRRWYVFWVAAFFPAAMVYALVSSVNLPVKSRILMAATKLSVVGAICLLFLFLLAAPTVMRVLTTDYNVAFQAYRSAFSPVGQVVNQFGLSLISVAIVGFVSLIADRRSRPLGLLVLTQAILSLFLFAHIQRLFGVQHFYIVVPALGIGIVGAVRAVWQISTASARYAALGAICGVTLASSSVAFSSPLAAFGPLLPISTYPPLKRTDLAEVDRLLAKLETLKAEKVYVVASSETLNWSTLKMRCRDTHPAFCEHLAQSADIDTRDGFPEGIADADYAVLATPVQYHVDPKDQQVVGLLARDFIARQGVGGSFEPIPGIFTLDHGVRVQIFQRIDAVHEADLHALADELLRNYPGMSIFNYRPRRAEPQSSSSS